MNRLGKNDGLIEQIVSDANLDLAIETVLRTKKRRKSKGGKRILTHREEVKQRLRKEISEGTFRITGYEEFQVKDGGKVRKVQCINLYQRIGVSAIMEIIERYVKRRYIKTTASSIEGRGMHYLLNIIRRDMLLHPDQMRFFYKNDIRKCYESIQQDFMMYALRRMFKDRILLTILERFVRMMPEGLSIGLRSSQSFCNMLLSMFLDHYLKDKYGLKHFYRYCDDSTTYESTKQECWRDRDLSHELVAVTGLEIKASERVAPVTEGVDFLGYVIYPDHTMLRKRIKQTAARKLHKVKSRKRRVQLLGSLYGQCKHANCRNLFKTLTGMSMEQYKRLKDLRIKPQYQDGKKRFNCPEINLCDLQGEEFLVLDYETGITTGPQRRDYDRAVERAERRLQEYESDGLKPPPSFTYPEDIPHPEGKHLIHLRKLNTGKEFKAYTGDKENYSILAQMKEQGFPIIASVEAIKCKGFTRYRLC